MAFDLTYVNAAATRIGEEPISSFSDGTAPAKIAAQNYDVLVKSELGRNRWKFATKSLALTALEDAPDEPWTVAYQLPTDILLIRTMKSNGLTFPYELQGTTILCDIHEDDGVVAHYTYRPDEVHWPPYFGELITRRLEALFLRSVGERYDEAEAREKAAERQLSEAKRLDSQSQTPVEAFTSPVLEARRA